MCSRVESARNRKPTRDPEGEAGQCFKTVGTRVVFDKLAGCVSKQSTIAIE